MLIRNSAKHSSLSETTVLERALLIGATVHPDAKTTCSHITLDVGLQKHPRDADLGKLRQLQGLNKLNRNSMKREGCP